MSSRNIRDTLATSMPFASHLTTTVFGDSSFGLLAVPLLDVGERNNLSVVCDMVWLRRAPNCKPCSPHCFGNVRRVRLVSTLRFLLANKFLGRCAACLTHRCRLHRFGHARTYMSLVAQSTMRFQSIYQQI